MPAILALLMLVLAAIAPALHAVESDSDPVAASDPDYAAGKKAIEARNWNAAIGFFSSAERRTPDNPDIQNYLGFAHRNAGRLDVALRHYQRALKLDPRHRGAHEYIGEAYLMSGNPAKAEEHLATLKRICPIRCEERDDLGKKIAAYKARRK